MLVWSLKELMMSNVFLSLGTNRGDRKNNLHAAIREISKDLKMRIIDISSVYETTPLHFNSETNFYNMVINIITDLKPIHLLKNMQIIEGLLGRDTGHNESRIIDIDILTYDDIQLKLKKLTIPHPRIKERKFVLQPWSEIDNNYKLPGDNLSIKTLLKSIDKQFMCKKIYNFKLKEILNV